MASLNAGCNRSDRGDLIQHAVAIPTLGWRLRVELKHVCSFEKTVRLGRPSVPTDSRRYRNCSHLPQVDSHGRLTDRYRAPFRQEYYLNTYPPFFSPKHQTEICL
jgi:hypothetical protein